MSSSFKIIVTFHIMVHYELLNFLSSAHGILHAASCFFIIEISR
jgi:hypothetical protein